jgi:hypothetical protein
MTARRRLPVLLALAAALLLGACATEPAPPAEPGGETSPTPSPTETAPGELPGEPFDMGPQEGAVLAVVGVAADDTLNMRSGPGVEFGVVAELAPLTDDVVATGESRMLDRGAVWVEATVDGVTGWANWRYLAYLGETDDIMSQLGDTGGSEMVDVADRVVAQLYGAESDVLTAVVVDGPHHGDLGEITVDVLGLMDDSVLGTRLHIFATPDGGRFTARVVEATPLCARGVDAGLCL